METSLMASGAKADAAALALAERLLESGHCEEARALAAEADGAGGEQQRQRLLAKAAARANRLGESQLRFRQALAHGPETHDDKTSLAIVLIALTEIEEAECLLREVLAEKPDHARALGGIGLIQLRAGRRHEAMTSFQHALDNGLDNPMIVRHYIEAALGASNRETAAPVMERYGHGRLSEAESLRSHAALLHELGRTREAAAKLEALRSAG